jgi:conjugative relaxase-like TrwC/TraI family protein
MLTISKPLSSTQAQTYHAKEFTAAEQSYWKQEDTIQGEWSGKLADELGLSGAIGALEFSRLAEGQHPATGEQLVRHRAVHEYKIEDGRTVTPVEHRAGWDATFSAPKSVSLTALVGGDDEVRQAHRQAVAFALNELEHYTQARIGGNYAPETTGRFVAATFEHDTARPVDGYAAPQLHTHSVIFNMTEREDGTMRALQPRSLFESQQFATAVYQSHLTYQLRTLGYEIEPGRSGAPEIKGYSQEYLDASSPRRQQIVEAVARSGFSGPEAAQIAAHNTRDGKQILSPAEVVAAHRQIAVEYGNQAENVVAEAQSQRKSKAHQISLEERTQQASSALTFARDKGFEREAVLDERAIFVDAMRRGMGEMTYPEVRASFESRIVSGEFREVSGSKHSAGRHFTTAGTIQAEKEIIRSVRDGHGQAYQLMSIQEAIPLTEGHQHLNQTQRRAAEQILTSRDQIQGLQGSAGSGKTSTLAVIRKGAEQNGYAVEGFAPTSRAAHQLREAGIAADTLQGFLARARNQSDPSQKHLYMVDESSLASTGQMRDFLAKIRAEDKVLLIGDIRQHQGVDAGKPFEQLQESGMRTALLDRIVRQKDPELLKAVQHLSKNEIETAIRLLQNQGRVTEVPDAEQRISTIAKSYAAHPENAIIVSPDNASRRALNQAVRQELQAAGLLETDNHSIPILTPRSDMTGADRAWAARYEAGDILHYVRGSKEHGINAGSYTQVVEVSPKDNLITVRKPDGALATYDPSRLRGITAYREIEREFAIGDRVQLTAPNRDLQVANRDLGTLKELGPGGQITLRMDSGKDVSFVTREMRHIDHGYAVTSHSSQGLTSERVLINMDMKVHPKLINARFAYVSVSRASHDAQIYTNDVATLADRLNREVSKTSAVALEKQNVQAPTWVVEQSLTTKNLSGAGIGLVLGK